MALDLKTLGPIVGAVAPMAGSLLGGLIPFPGGSIIGQKVGEMVAVAFGVDPKAADATKQVSDRIAEAGEETARAKIQAVVEKARIEVDGFVAYERAVLEATVKNLSDVNATMRVETEGRIKLALAGVREHWFFTAGRPTSLWIFNVVNLVFGLLLCAATGKAVWLSSDPLGTLTAAWPLFAAYFVPLCAVNGVFLNARSNEKVAAITAGAPMPNAKPPNVGPAGRPPDPVKVQSATKPAAGRVPDPPGSRP